MNEPRYTALTEDELKDRLQAVMTERDELRARVNELSVHLEMCADVDAAHCIEIVEQGEQIMALLEALKAVEWFRYYEHADQQHNPGWCPWCLATEPGPHNERCQRQAAIAAVEGE